MARAWKLARGRQRVPRVLLLCAASGMTEAEAALAGAHVTSVSVQPSRGWCGTHLQTSAEDYLVELRAEYKQRLRRLERAGTLERVALVQLLSSWGLWRLRRQDICLAHPSCKIIGTCGRAQGRSKREVQRALQLPLDLLLDKSGVFEAVYVENPAGGILQQRWRALGHAPTQIIEYWQFGNTADDRNRTAKQTAIFAGLTNSSVQCLAPDNQEPPRRGLILTEKGPRGERGWLDMWGVGMSEREFAREATPPGLAHAYARDLLVL